MFCERTFKIIFLFFSIMFLLEMQSASACSCGATPNVLEAFEASDQVVILKALSVEKADSNSDEQYFVDEVKSTKMVVEKVYKGTLKVGDEINFAQGGGADCIWTFNEKSINESYLFYLATPQNNKDLWYGFGCGRSKDVRGADADLAFLDNLDTLLGKTRISGKFDCHYENCPNISQKKVKFISSSKTVYETITDKDGLYEIYDLPAGIYFIEPEIPVGWKVSNYWLRYSTSLIDTLDSAGGKQKNRFAIELEEKKHAELNFSFEIDNTIRGRLLNPSGKPMKNTCVYAIRSESDSFNYGSPGCTDDTGNFSITELYGKSYVIVINGDEKIRAKQPFEKLFYPGVNERSEATVINIAEGKEIKLKDFRIPKFLETIKITGKLYYSNGNIVTSHQNVQFIENEKVGNYEPNPYVYTDDNGDFVLKIFKGQTGKIRANMILGSRHLETCPDLKNSIIEDNIGGSITVSTLWTEIKADKNLSNVKLIFPFQECKKD
jgi:hypothetical protein